MRLAPSPDAAGDLAVRVAAVAVQAARLRHPADPELTEIRALLLRALDAIEAEHAAEQAAHGASLPLPARSWYAHDLLLPDAKLAAPIAMGEGLG